MKRIYKTITVDKAWIEKNIVKPGWQRNLYRSNVNKFINHIKNETFKQSLITVSSRDGSLVLLDGQHKLEAIKETEILFRMDLCIYEDLTEIEEIEIYIMLNDVKQQRLIDDIKLYVGRHDWLDAFLDETHFPINVNLGITSNSIRIDKFLNILYNGFMEVITRNNLSRKKLPIFLKTLDSEKYALMKDFCILYKKCFGDPSSDNWLYTRNTVFFTLMRIWLKNKDNLDDETIIKCFKQIPDKQYIKQDTVSVDVATLESMTRKMYRVINKGRSVNKFERFWDED